MPFEVTTPTLNAHPMLRIQFADFPYLNMFQPSRLHLRDLPCRAQELCASALRGPLKRICYYHQDLHRGRLQPGSHPKAFSATPATFLLVGASGPARGQLCADGRV
jgi:hypothetical protein